MEDEQKKAEEAVANGSQTDSSANPVADTKGAPRGRGRGRGGRDGERRGRTGGRRGDDRQRSEFDQRTIVVRRVARVMAGGRRFNFSAAIVAGDRKGRVGIGLGKGLDTALAIEKALRDAKKNMIRVKTTKTMSIPHDVEAKFSSGIVEIRPAASRGIVAGSAVKLVLELAGVTDVTAKILSGSKNKLNIARATVKALSQLKK
ncbi:MAG: 30S ribosomal protein S5 [Patescibacteria group bacterium]|nr:30S ribosomal protein S5 [Patescibacteria group bacterium]